VPGRPKEASEGTDRPVPDQVLPVGSFAEVLDGVVDDGVCAE
jgi:hypothetical protein